jgi:hypothetical protein
MKELLKEVELSVKSELERANKVHPLFNSPHEAYAVIKEEEEEAEHEWDLMKDNISWFWAYVKHDDSATDVLDYLKQTKENAMNLAAEAIQVAAMAQKAIDSMGVKQK